MVLRTALSDPEVNANMVAEVVRRVTGLMRHCRPEVYTAGTEPQRAEFVLLLAAARCVAFACDDLDECVHILRMRAENEFEGYTFGLDYEIAALCCGALEQVILKRRYPTHGTCRKSDVLDSYMDTCLSEYVRKNVLERLVEHEQRVAAAAEETLALAS